MYLLTKPTCTMATTSVLTGCEHTRHLGRRHASGAFSSRAFRAWSSLWNLPKKVLSTPVRGTSPVHGSMSCCRAKLRWMASSRACGLNDNADADVLSGEKVDTVERVHLCGRMGMVNVNVRQQWSEHATEKRRFGSRRSCDAVMQGWQTGKEIGIQNTTNEQVRPRETDGTHITDCAFWVCSEPAWSFASSLAASLALSLVPAGTTGNIAAMQCVAPEPRQTIHGPTCNTNRERNSWTCVKCFDKSHVSRADCEEQVWGWGLIARQRTACGSWSLVVCRVADALLAGLGMSTTTKI
jgi:hypothetical protein